MTSEFPLLRNIWTKQRINARIALHSCCQVIFYENKMRFSWDFFFLYANRNTWFTYIRLCISCQPRIPLTRCFWSPHSFNRPSNWFFFLAICILYRYLSPSLSPGITGADVGKLWFRARRKHSCKALKHEEWKMNWHWKCSMLSYYDVPHSSLASFILSVAGDVCQPNFEVRTAFSELVSIALTLNRTTESNASRSNDHKSPDALEINRNIQIGSGKWLNPLKQIFMCTKITSKMI